MLARSGRGCCRPRPATFVKPSPRSRPIRRGGICGRSGACRTDSASGLVWRVSYTLEDAAATAAYHSSRDQERVPIELVDRLLAGENPVKVWREHRGLSQRDLAARAGLNFAYLSQVETGSRNGSIQTVKKLAEALGVDLDDLI